MAVSEIWDGVRRKRGYPATYVERQSNMNRGKSCVAQLDQECAREPEQQVAVLTSDAMPPTPRTFHLFFPVGANMRPSWGSQGEN
eukprot:3783638-Pyramimonas_sp.AAC.1